MFILCLNYFITTVQIRPLKNVGPIVHTIVIGHVIFTVELGGGNRPMQAMQPLFQQLDSENLIIPCGRRCMLICVVRDHSNTT